MRTARKGKVAMALAAVVAALTTAVFAVTSAFAGPTTPTPTIRSGPSGTVTSTSATFAYQDTAPSVSFICALDGGSFTACGTGTPTTTASVTYTGLAQGAHTFQVEARAKGSSTSSPASRSWSVDTSAPTVTMTFPTSNGSYNGAGWNAGCTTAGLCGTAADPNGVTGVQVAILQQSTSRYWNGSGFASAAIDYRTATGTTAWSYSLPFSALADGSYTVSRTATDSLGNATPLNQAAVSSFRIDTLAPPVPAITNQPTNPTSNTSAEFHFNDSEAGVSFRCQLDSGAFAPCTDGVIYNNVAVGDHCFAVVAVDPAGNLSTAASYCWTVVLQGNFPIKGDLTSPMAPGVTQPLNLVFTNPNNFAITVTAVTVTVQDATIKNGLPNPDCRGPQNMSVSRAFNGQVAVPANSTKSLSELGTPPGQWPLITMPDLNTNQDACKNTTFKFSYTGTATR
ncbi:MAG: hypothetical protein ABR511_01355 [Acidimicrobiales bacterium]